MARKLCSSGQPGTKGRINRRQIPIGLLIFVTCARQVICFSMFVYLSLTTSVYAQLKKWVDGFIIENLQAGDI